MLNQIISCLTLASLLFAQSYIPAQHTFVGNLPVACIAGPTGFVQAAAAGGVFSCTVPLPNPTTTGNQIVFMLQTWNGSPPGISDSAGDTYTQIDSATAGGAYSNAYFAIATIATGSSGFSIHSGATAEISGCYAEELDRAIVGTIDAHTLTALNTNATAVPSGPATTTQNNDILVTLAQGIQPDPAQAPASGYTYNYNGYTTGANQNAASCLAGGPGSYSSTWSAPGGVSAITGWSTELIAFKHN